MKSPFSLRASAIAASMLSLSLVATGCGDDDDKDPIINPEKPLYAVVTQVSTGDESTSYVVVTDKIDSTESLTLTNAIEIPGRALASGISKSGTVFVSAGEGARLTRYDLDSSGQLKANGTIDFAGRGITSFGEYQNQFQFVSDTKAYYFDGRTAQVIIFNPTAMTITDAKPLPGLTIDGATTTFATVPIRTTDLIIMPVGWRPSASIGITKKAGVVAVNPGTDSVTVATDDRCGYVRDGVVGPDGDVYLATEAYGAAVYRTAGGETPVPCLLKFDTLSLTFDGGFYRELRQLTGQATTGSLLPGASGTAYLRVLDESVYTIAPGTHPRVVASAQAWRWYQLNLANLTSTLVDTLPASTGSAFIYNVQDNRVLFTEFTNSSSQTNFRELTDKSGKVVLTTQGLSFSMLQLR